MTKDMTDYEQQLPQWHQQQPPQPPQFPPMQHPAHVAKPKKKRRVFLWVFLAIQVLFVAWLISAAVQGTGASANDIASTCGHGQWQGLWKSYSDCAQHSGVVAAHDVGKGIAVGLIVVIWIVVDFLVAVPYGIYRLAKR